MKITKKQLKKLIKEEYTKLITEMSHQPLPPSLSDSDIRTLDKIWNLARDGYKLVIKNQRGSLYTGIGNRQGLYGFAAQLAAEKWVRGERSLFRKLKKLQVGDIIQEKHSAREIYNVGPWTQGLYELFQMIRKPEELEDLVGIY